ncbi:MAG: hypothetical protein KGI60_00320 [Patescibacteria group bacterium]|nr:hypothetical protein [Patescibacteria group bacterium]
MNPTALVMSIGTITPALAIGAIGAAGLIAMARNPQVADKIQISMIVAIAFAEAIAIYALVVALLLKFIA